MSNMKKILTMLGVMVVATSGLAKGNGVEVVWGNVGSETESGIAVRDNYGGYTTFDVNFDVSDNISQVGIKGGGFVRITKIRLYSEYNYSSSVPNSITISQDGLSDVVSTSVTFVANLKIYGANWPSMASNYWIRGAYEAQYNSNVLFDTSKPIKLSFPYARVFMLQPANSVMKSYNDWSPAIEIIGEYKEKRPPCTCTAILDENKKWSELKWNPALPEDLYSSDKLIINVEEPNSTLLMDSPFAASASLTIDGGPIVFGADEAFYEDGCWIKDLLGYSALTATNGISYVKLKNGYFGEYIQDKTGIKLRAQNKEVISINFANGYVVGGMEYTGLAPVRGSTWMNMTERWYSETTTDLGAFKATADGETLVIHDTLVGTCSADGTDGYYDASAEMFLKGYLDDGGNHARIFLQNIPYDTYDVIVYCSTYGSGYKFSPVSVNGADYTYDEKHPDTAIVGTDAWGRSRNRTAVYGVNALRIRNINSPTLSIMGGEYRYPAHGGIAAVQIVEISSIQKPVIMPASGTTFDSSLTVSISCAAEEATIRYTTDGSDPTTDSAVYSLPFTIYDKTTVKAIACFEDGTTSKVVIAEYAHGRCENPVIIPPDGTEFDHEGQEVSIAWDGEDGVLRYTTDGGDPTKGSPQYTGPFTIDETTVIKAKAFGKQYFDSAIVVARLKRVGGAPIPVGLWNGHFDLTNSAGKIVLSNGYTLSVNGNSVSSLGDKISIGDKGVLLDWPWDGAKTNITVLVRCEELPPVERQSAVMSLWDEYSFSDLVGVSLQPKGNTSGIWESRAWTSVIGKALPIGGEPCVLALRYNGGSGYVGNPYGGTGLFAVTNEAVDEIYFDVVLKRSYCKCDGVTIGGCRTSTVFSTYSGMQITGVAIYHEYMTEQEILAASKVFGPVDPRPRVARPTMPSAGTYETISKEITLSCDTEDAIIYYTIDGTNPSSTNGRRYKGPFNIYETVTVKAIAVKQDWRDSAMVSTMFTKGNPIGPAINLLEMLPDNDETYPWSVVTDVTHDGVSAVRSGAISDDELTTLKVAIYGAGQLSFWWRTSCEHIVEGEYYDYATFYNGTTVVTNIAGVTDWQKVTLDVPGTGKHTFKWTYQKDGSYSTVPDGVWLDQVQWLPETTDYYADHTLTTEAPVKYKWLRSYGLAIEDDFEAAAKAKTGKIDGAGRVLTVEDDFVAGTDPTNLTSRFTSAITMEGGIPKITWTPDLGETRLYKVLGKESLVGGDWQYPTNSTHRFFKVTVEMP